MKIGYCPFCDGDSILSLKGNCLYCGATWLDIISLSEEKREYNI